MWIQEWRPRTNKSWLIHYGIWQESEGLYLSLWRNKGSGHPATMSYHITQAILQSSYKPYLWRPVTHRPVLIRTGTLDYVGRPKELNRAWDWALENPSAFIMRQML